MSNTGGIAAFDVERVVTGPFSGMYVTIGSPLGFNPVIIIFDNQSTVTVDLSIDGTNSFKTFVSGEAMLLDLRSNIGLAQNYTIPIGTQFYINATGGTGSFNISMMYAR